MKQLKELLLERKDDSISTLPKWCDVVKISPNNYDGTIEYMTVDEIKKDSSLSKVLKLEPWESVVIDEDIYVMIIDVEALNEK
jgi:hypothetical protein